VGVLGDVWARSKGLLHSLNDTCADAQLAARAHAHLWAHTHTCGRTRIPVRPHTYTHTNTHTNTRTYTHTHIHTTCRWVLFDDDDLHIKTGDDILALSGGGDWHMAYLLLYRAVKVPRKDEP